MRLIGLAGHAGVGKDYITRNYLVEHARKKGIPFVVVAFADHFKVDAIVKLKLPRDKVFGKKDESVRKALQEYGTEQGRNVFGEDIWVEILNETLVQHFKRGIEIAFITDCRFPNEIKYIHSHGGKVIYIEGDRICESMGGTISTHSSETSISSKDCDFVIDNSVEKGCEAGEKAVKILDSFLRLGFLCSADDSFL